MQNNKLAKGYSFVDFPMNTFFKHNADSYINSKINKTIFEYKKNLFDIKSLNRLVNLDCMNCHWAHTRLCCEGSPYPPVKEDIKNVEKYLDEILSDMQSEENYIKAKRKIESNNSFINSEGSFINNCGKCLFFVKQNEEGLHLCAIHGFALKNNMDYTKLKPKGCLMYPIDMVELIDGNTFVFGLDEETAVDTIEIDGLLGMKPDTNGFSRWNNKDLDFICLNKSHRELILKTNKPQSPFSKGTLPDNMFELKNYKPIYEQEKQLIVNLFGEDTYEFIKNKSCELLNDSSTEKISI